MTDEMWGMDRRVGGQMGGSKGLGSRDAGMTHCTTYQ